MNLPAIRKATGATVVDPSMIRISKDVIELLTSGMYVSPITVYREYVQNAADAVDEARSLGLLRADEPGRVEITIEHTTRTVTVRDNGAGVPSSSAASVLMAVGGSKKRGTNARGFRGVGRLSGLAYCKALTFASKAAGDPFEVRLTWDCKSLRSRLSQSSGSDDLRTILAQSVSMEVREAADQADHYFEVTMSDVARHRQDVLLNEALVAGYLSQVAPVAFADKFTHAVAIVDHLREHGAWQPPLYLTVNGDAVLRPHADALVVPGSEVPLELREVELITLSDVDGEVGAVGWIAHHQYIRSIPVGLKVRGLRVRSGNIQIGEENTFEELFKETRFNSWFVGEVHVIDQRLKPNARRDNFELNHHFYNLTAQLSTFATSVSHLCRVSSVARNSIIQVKSAISEVRATLERSVLTGGEVSQARGRLERCWPRLKRVRDEEAATQLGSELDEVKAKLDAVQLADSERVLAFNEVTSLVMRYVTNRQQARELIAALERVGAGASSRDG